MTPLLQKVVAWLREGYPQGLPDRDYLPLMAVLRRQLSEPEMNELGDALVANGMIPADRIDVGVGISKVTQELPSVDEMTRVTEHLRAQGLPIELGDPTVGGQ